MATLCPECALCGQQMATLCPECALCGQQMATLCPECALCGQQMQMTRREVELNLHKIKSVSYTHLTLPTILLV